jgi:hypothetical protein
MDRFTPRLRIVLPMAAMALASPGVIHAQTPHTVTGTLTAVHGDPGPEAGGEHVVRWFLTSRPRDHMEVEVPNALLRAAGGMRAVDRRVVRASGVLTTAAVSGSLGRRVLRATTLQPVQGSMAGLHAPPQVGSHPYAVLLCRFGDLPAEPKPRSFFEQLMGDGYPNMSHYFAESSGGRMDLDGTRAFGWYPLPEPHASYFDPDTGAVLLYRLADDCLAAADADVDFSVFRGIVVQVNGPLSRSGQGLAWGGSMALALDGPARAWPFVWMPLWAVASSRYGIYAHELGHSLGLPHSSGPYGQTYDSSWDVMSRPYLRWEPDLSAWVPGGTIAFHKQLLGWVPADRAVTMGPAGHPPGPDVLLDAHTGGSGALVVRVNIPGSPDFYTVEARRRAGYDRGLPGEAVILHRVPDPDGPGCTLHRCAEVVDGYGNGDPNDAGAMWLPGDTFDDGMIRISVTETTEDGWALSVEVRAPSSPPGLTVPRAAEALFHGEPLSAEELEYLDLMGNRNGRYDLGDFLSFVRSGPR